MGTLLQCNVLQLLRICNRFPNEVEIYVTENKYVMERLLHDYEINYPACIHIFPVLRYGGCTQSRGQVVS